MNTAAILLMIVGCNGGAEDCRGNFLRQRHSIHPSNRVKPDNGIYRRGVMPTILIRIFGVLCIDRRGSRRAFDTEIVWDVTAGGRV